MVLHHEMLFTFPFLMPWKKAQGQPLHRNDPSLLMRSSETLQKTAVNDIRIICTFNPSKVGIQHFLP